MLGNILGPAHLPLVVDLDGTLIFNDVTSTALRQYLVRVPWGVAFIALWGLQGMAFVKQKIGLQVVLTPQDLDYNEALISALRAEKSKGREVILATGADARLAEQAVGHLDLFSAVIASDGKCNCVSFGKAEALNARYGAGNYAYAGNSTQDYAVWAQSGHAIAVNTPPEVLMKLQQINVPQSVFIPAQAVERLASVLPARSSKRARPPA